MPSTLPPLLQDSAHLHHPALVAEAVDQINQTVQQLLLAALERARHASAGSALPAPSVPSTLSSAQAVLPVPLSAREHGGPAAHCRRRQQQGHRTSAGPGARTPSSAMWPTSSTN